MDCSASVNRQRVIMRNIPQSWVHLISLIKLWLVLFLSPIVSFVWKMDQDELHCNSVQNHWTFDANLRLNYFTSIKTLIPLHHLSASMMHIHFAISLKKPSHKQQQQQREKNRCVSIRLIERSMLLTLRLFALTRTQKKKCQKKHHTNYGYI